MSAAEGVAHENDVLHSAPPLPVKNERNVLVTSALPYVNNYPHLGNIIGAVLSADVYARFLRQRSVNVIYVCGTDEYGTATETKAQQENLTPRQICDKYHALHAEVYAWFDLQFDVFGRTSTPRQTEIVHEIFHDVYDAGYVSRDTIDQLYCEKHCKRFLADRYVRGVCPNCAYDDARGDQCDGCGNMLNPTDLLNPKCSTCGNAPVSRETTHLFLDLPRLQPVLEKWVREASEKGDWSSNALSMTDTWLRDGLKRRCITRDLEWGVPVPIDGLREKVFYVWFDAPIGYPSITAKLCGEDWRKWWLPEANCDVDLVQFMGKDNVPFHTIVFPASLLATGKKWTMLHKISTTEYLNYETGKFSKSRGVGVFGNDAIETGIPSEVWRYYLLINRPEGSDSVFAWDDLAVKNNDELLKTLGNYINRTVTFLDKYFFRVVPKLIGDDAENDMFTAKINAELKEYIAFMDKVSLKAGLKKAMAIAAVGNQYLQAKAPWHLLKAEKTELAGSALTYSANLVVLLTVVLEPFLGSKFSIKVFAQLGLDYVAGENNHIPNTFDPAGWLQEGHKIGKPEILFTALTAAQIRDFRVKYGGEQRDGKAEGKGGKEGNMGFPLDLRVGRVVDAREHENSDRLFVAKVCIGEEGGTRCVVAGLREAYTVEELVGAKVILVCNLAVANLAGIDSQGMILVGEKKKVMKILTIDESVSVGERITAVGCALNLSSQPLNRKDFQAASKRLRIGKGGIVMLDKKFGLAAEASAGQQVYCVGVPEGGKVK